MVLDVRGTPETIDGPWLTAALEQAGVARGATVTGVDFRGFIGTGQTGRNARFSLTWDDSTGRPASVVAKFPSDDPNARNSAFTNGNYLREHVFYNDVAHTVRVRTPQVYAALYDAATPDFVLLMEDVSGAVQGDQLAGLTIDQAVLACEQAVLLHAPRWGDDSIDVHLGDGLSPEERMARMSMFYGFTKDPFLARLGHRLDDEVIDLVQKFADSVGRWVLGTETPRTVVHMDYRPDNFLFGTQEGAPPIVVVDWQTATAGLGMCDLAYMIGGGFLPEQRAAVERDLVEGYRQKLVAEGVQYDADTCWHDYRFASLWGVAMTVIATVMAEETERGNDMLTAMAQRHGRHALDMDALSLLT